MSAAHLLSSAALISTRCAVTSSVSAPGTDSTLTQLPTTTSASSPGRTSVSLVMVLKSISAVPPSGVVTCTVCPLTAEMSPPARSCPPA
ncbi:Uncharacterised protein [Mycobacteroides abscessus subsp. abscessus]|nr:Uncharacterised protein [Mycobacteroides abscessus subsp. abscessus]